MQHLSEKMQFQGFLFPRQCRSTSYVRWKNKASFIAYFLSNISVKNTSVHVRHVWYSTKRDICAFLSKIRTSQFIHAHILK